ncbi:penicillin acylase family protein [Robertkochia sediminum]|uniref:penicillin acylase family protein n=1 Tax=Robertkochia sediminum TaxID=2785326 RepID=UPI0019329DC7|nr:penicillin acylase family protein [Robertkochia sediminum]MBL7473048.1 penicillin acylase family protein [Robertkochia sediminum]
MKKLRYPFLAILVIFLAIYLTAWITAPGSPDLKDYVEKAQQYQVEVIRDSLGVPHVYGKTDADVAFGLGYAQSEDDFNTLHDVLLATRGMMASKYGYTAAKTDYVVNLMGVWDAVNAKYTSEIPEGVREIAEAYADGVNLYAVKHPGEWSPYLFPVTGKDVIAGFTFKTPMFYGFDKALGAMMAPREPESMDTDGEVAFLWNSDEKAPLGSQGIAVAPSRSEGGLTRLLVNSHQPLEGPVSWYEVRLHSEEGWNMAGGTFPGSPVVIHGHNDKLGWANTVNKPDLVDFYQLEVNPQDEGKYLLDGEWVDFEVKTAEILVSFLGPVRWTFEKPIRISEHGPVLETDHGWYAVRWAGMGEVQTLEFLYKLNKAENKAQFEDALAMNAMPSINYIYADHQGNIGHYYNAMFPKRQDGYAWHEVLPGDRSALVWEDYLPFELMPKTVNPESGFVYNANNTPFSATDGDDDAAAADYPGYMGIEKRETNRSLQIERMAQADTLIGAEDFYKMKYDSRYHSEYTPVKRLLNWIATPDLDNMMDPVYREALMQLRQWNLETKTDNETAALAILTLNPLLGDHEITDLEITEAFKQAVDQLYRFYNTTRIPLGEVQKLQRGQKQLPVGGGPDVLRAIYTDGLNAEGKMVARAGDGFTMLVAWDSTGLKTSKAIHQYGAATNREGSEHYNDQMEKFVNQELRNVPFDKEVLLQQAERRYHPIDGGL